MAICGGRRARRTEQGGQGLSSFQELAGSYGIVVLLVDGHIGEGFLEGVEEGSAGRVCFCGCHCVGGLIREGLELLEFLKVFEGV